MGTYPKVKQTEKAIPIRARDFDLVSVSVTSPIIAVLSWTFPSLSPPIKRESRKDAYSQLGRDGETYKSGRPKPYYRRQDVARHGCQQDLLTSISIRHYGQPYHESQTYRSLGKD
jgi:hypothetical protein